MIFDRIRDALSTLHHEAGGSFQLSIDEGEELIQAQAPRPGTSSVRIQVAHDQQIDIDVGLATHYDVYSNQPSELVSAALSAVSAAIAGELEEQIWERDGSVVASQMIWTRTGAMVKSSGPGFRPKRGVTQRTYRFEPYILNKDL